LSFAQGDPARREPLRWPRRPDPGAADAGATTLKSCLLDVDDELSEELESGERELARQLAVATVFETETEEELYAGFGAVGQGPGLLVLDGLIAFETRVVDRVAAELLGPGDLLQRPCDRTEALITQLGDWRILSPARLALLDGEFADRVRPVPKIIESLLRRAARRSSEIDALRAITGQPRLEVRLVLLFWLLAARWGRVEPAGIRLSLPLTHRLLGQLVAAERPSVTHALKRLARAELVTGTTFDLHLHGNLNEHLDALRHHEPWLVDCAGSGDPRHRISPASGISRREVF
jgi:CRP/FNR family cyclic AMP-dependent transcriptional regulator